MTRKDYVMIAAALRETLAHIASNGDSERLSDNGRTFNSGEQSGVRYAALRVMEALARAGLTERLAPPGRWQRLDSLIALPWRGEEHACA